MKKYKDSSNRITEGVIWKQLLLFFFPLLFGTFFQQLYNTTDAVVVGRFVGKEALSAVGGTTGTLINLLVGFFVGLSAGATVTISQFYGAKQDEDVEKAVHTAAAMSIVGGVIIMVVGILGAPLALRLIGTPEEVIPYSLTYIRIYFCGMIANLFYNIGAGILRAIGDSRKPLYFLIVSCFINIVLDLLFVVVFHWGVMGVAVATVISQVGSAALVFLTLYRTKESYRLNPTKIRFHRDLLKRIIRIGIPAGFQSLMYTSSNIIIQSRINSFGTDTMAAWTAYAKIDGIFWMTMNAFGISITTFVGQNYGAGKVDRIKKGVRVCLKMCMSVAILLSIAMYFWGPYVYHLFTDDEAVLKIGIEVLRFLVPTFFTYVFVEILSGSLRGMGNSLVPMLLTGLGVCALRVVWIFTAVRIWRDIKVLILSYPLAWVVTSILFIIYYLYYTRKHLYKAGLQQ